MSFFDDLMNVPSGSIEERARAVDAFESGDVGALERWATQLDREQNLVREAYDRREKRLFQGLCIVVILAAGVFACWKMLP